MATAAFEAEGLSRRFGARSALSGVTLAAAPGEVLALFGPNGAGKSTLLRVLATLLRPTAGRLRLFGEPPGPSSRRRIGLLGHDTFLYPDLTATENLGFYARLFGLEVARERVEELLEWAGLGDRLTQPVRTYSRGLAQRLALARLRLHEPALLLLDEPFTGLDPEAAGAVERLVGAAREEGRTVVLTTHELARGVALATRVAILHRGRLAWTADRRPELGEVVEAYRGLGARSQEG